MFYLVTSGVIVTMPSIILETLFETESINSTSYTYLPKFIEELVLAFKDNVTLPSLPFTDVVKAINVFELYDVLIWEYEEYPFKSIGTLFSSVK